ncbi:hypothetical protein QE450_002158 [Paenibacillus sp. SORGH_AS306]|uniref:DUF3298 and DUF4163 domain-containing protein n=1 Tax=unclassified Paenibacillus TaxID=185978 RepID=UPI00278447F8|nr:MULTISPECIES: DUF3298 and DUF4163 domain-containing protein [unclassified Paenibacillus]MDQ1234660.1 hypothetical protein [Paenibacillus sp. SORGH_AS_0306]MDR6111705.1 hypothetical protein [Paenibacillus sp. SORGH_AS_0338]
MKLKTIVYVMITLLVVISTVAIHPVDAANTITVQTKTYKYKGQPYVQLTGGNKEIIAKINKTLKIHAVHAAKYDTENKKTDKSYFYLTDVSVKYNHDEKISIIYSDYLYTGGTHGMPASIDYNFDLRTGKLLHLNSVITNKKQMNNLKTSLSQSLQAKYDAGENIFQEAILDFNIDNKTTFYFYNKGIVIRFNQYEVAPYSEGTIDIKVPYTAINQ